MLKSETPLSINILWIAMAANNASLSVLSRSSLSSENIRRECVESIMGNTTILSRDGRKVLHVQGLYGKLYDLSTMTSCMLHFLGSQSGVRVMVDCDTNRIGNMKAKVTDHDGVEWSGNDWISFADFSERTVYLGGKVDILNKEEKVLGRFARALAQMSNLLAFGNEGKPYKLGDATHEQEFRRALEEVERKMKRGEEFDWVIERALQQKTQLANEIYFASVVPWIIAYDGLVEGTSILRKHVPLLLTFYEDHVMVTLKNKAKVI